MSIEGSRRNYSWAAFLIILGIVLLLNTTNIVGWGIWVFTVRFWPVLIVLLGLRIILGGSLLSRILQMIITILLTGAIFLISYIQYTQKPLTFLPDSFNSWVFNGGGGLINLSIKSLEGEYAVSSEENAQIEGLSLTMDLRASSFTLMEDDIEDILVINAKYPKTDDEPILSHEIIDNKLDIQFSSASSNSFSFFSNKSEYDIRLNRSDIPLNMDIKLGTGEGDVLFETVKIGDFYGDIGAGKISVKLGIDSIPTGDVRFTVGAGKIILVLPQRVGYQVEYDLGVGSIRSNGEDISGVPSGRGKFTSTNYSDSDIKLNLFVTVGVGSFEIENE